MSKTQVPGDCQLRVCFLVLGCHLLTVSSHGKRGREPSEASIQGHQSQYEALFFKGPASSCDFLLG